MSNYTEKDIENAIQKVGNGISRRAAAAQYGIPESTLRRRLTGIQSRQKSHEWRQKLLVVQEASLRDWIIVQDNLGFPPSHTQVIDFAGRVAKRNGYTEPIGTHWMEAFLRRNPEVKTIKGQKLDSERFNGASTENILAFFEYLDVPVVKAIKPENRYNMDETGIMEGLGYNGLVLGSAEKNRTIIQNPSSRN